MEPDYCGEVDMAITADGTWLHEGVPIKRAELWQLFAGILRREDDSEYYLVTPVEKCRVSVALHPLIITDIEPCETRQGPGLAALLNAGGRYPISLDYPLKLEQKASGAAYIELPHGLSALCSRAAWYRLVDMADDSYSVMSHGARFFWRNRPGSHVGVVGPSKTFRRNPRNVLRGVLDIAGFAMHTVLGVDLEPGTV